MAQIQIIPAFTDFPQEALHVGAILSGYSVLEFWLLQCLTSAIGDPFTAVKVLYRTRGEEQRIIIADALMRDRYALTSLANPYCEAIADLQWCRKIRNQYAHCYWELSATKRDFLTFVNLEEVAKKHGTLDVQDKDVERVDLALLKAQTTYFVYVRGCLMHLHYGYNALAGRSPIRDSPLLKKLPRPPLSNGPASPAHPQTG